MPLIIDAINDESVVHEYKPQCVVIDHFDNDEAATRLAITLLAARITNK